MASETHLRFLGPAQISGPVGPVLVKRQPLRLLAILAARSGSWVTSDELSDHLWGSELPKTGRSQLKVVVKRLRIALGEYKSLVKTAGEGYQLGDARIDTKVFVELVREASREEDDNQIISLLESALAEWRGCPFVGAEGPEILERYRAELEQLKDGAEVRLAEALTATGRYNEAAALLRSGFSDRAFVEPRALVLARSLTFQGDRSGALEILAKHESALEQELQVGPSQAVIELRDEIAYGGLDFAQQRSATALGSRAQLELLIGLGRTMRLLGVPEQLPNLERAGDISRDQDLPDQLGHVLIELCSHGRTTKAGGSHAATVSLLDHALKLKSMSAAIRIEMLASSSALMTASNLTERGQSNFRTAYRLARASGDPELEAKVLMHMHLGLSHPAEYDDRDAAISRLAELISDDPDQRWEVAYLRFWQSVVAGDLRTGGQILSELQALNPRAIQRRVSLLHVRSAYEIVCGHFDEAAKLMEAAFSLAMTAFPESWAKNHRRALLFGIRVGQGRAAALEPDIPDEVSSLDEMPNWLAAKAFIFAEAGRHDEALEILDDFFENDFEELTPDLTWTGAAWALALTARNVGHIGSARLLYDLLEPHAGKLSWIAHCTLGAVDDARRELATLFEPVS